MLVFIVVYSCLLYILSSGQTTPVVVYPTLGPVNPIPNNDSMLNFTFIYPANYQFVNLYVQFTIYDFVNNTVLSPTKYPFSWANFTNSNTSLPWVVPNILLIPGDYVFGCFEWVQTDASDLTLSDINECVLTRASINSTTPPIVPLNVSNPVATATSITFYTYMSLMLPYDQVNITANINGTIQPSITNTTSNATYNINMFYFMNLTQNTPYNICISYIYANSLIKGSNAMDTSCDVMTTSSTSSVSSIAPASSTLPTPSTSSNATTLPTPSTSSNATTARPSSGNSFNKTILYLMITISIFISIFI
ncbi:unnamed protein product [Adineta steineri]|uniref:Fibronectin type-III domain-containing protein n=1 Tax=Adineta steineri TaxID=433720 RepID=A0A814F2W4_9BILA|nr:unnamed protein product [Adineta steineri]CAF3838475.1 unnamed protein product [Adineta steineri]